MKPLVKHWFPLTHSSECMTTSWSAAAIQIRVRVSPAVHNEVSLRWMPCLLQPSLFMGLETSLEYVGLHVLTLGFRDIQRSKEIAYCSLIHGQVVQILLSVTNSAHPPLFLFVSSVLFAVPALSSCL